MEIQLLHALQLKLPVTSISLVAARGAAVLLVTRSKDRGTKELPSSLNPSALRYDEGISPHETGFLLGIILGRLCFTSFWVFLG